MSGRRRRTDAGGGHRARPELDIVEALDQEAQIATLVGAEHRRRRAWRVLRSDRRAARRAEQDKRRRYFQLGGIVAAVIVLLVLAVLGIRALIGGDDNPTGESTSTDIAARTSVLISLTGAEETAEAAVLVGWDAGLTKGGAFTVPAGVLVDVAGLGQLPLADALPDAGGEESTRAFATAVGVDVAGSWVLDESALSALVEEVGGVTVDVDVDVTEPGAEGAAVIVPPVASRSTAPRRRRTRPSEPTARTASRSRSASDGCCRRCWPRCRRGRSRWAPSWSNSVAAPLVRWTRRRSPVPCPTWGRQPRPVNRPGGRCRQRPALRQAPCSSTPRYSVRSWSRPD